MSDKIKDPYIAALLNGLHQPDWLALDESGNELLEKAKKLLKQPATQPPIGLLSAITGRVWPDETERENRKAYYFEPSRLSISEEAILPREMAELNISLDFKNEITEEIESVYNQFKGKGNLPEFRYTLFHSVYALGSRVAFGDSDVSAFDDNRLLAATVQCLKQDSSDFLLVKGAVSGIQSFIYHDIGGEQIDDAKKASKRLRGRSFLVAHLCQMAAEYIVESLGLEQANILFVGGGHFNLLLPGSKAVEDELIAIRKKLNLGLFENVGMQLSLVLGWEEANANELFDRPAEYYQKVNDQLEFGKQKKHVDYLAEFFQCKEKPEKFNDDETLGTRVPYADYLVELSCEEEEKLLDFNKSVSKQYAKPTIAAFQFLGKQFYLLKEEEVQSFFKANEKQLKAVDLVKLARLNGTDFLRTINVDIPIGLGFQFIGKEAPKKQEEGIETIKMFEDIAAMEGTTGTLSFPQLAVMRLDVDDLGLLFRYGFGEVTTFGQIASLSREFQLFFGGYFNQLAEAEGLYITYSGGDDAFLIGSWYNVVKFACSLHKNFKQFACHNRYITLSAGIFTCSPFYPVVRFAKDAEDLEKEAKGMGKDKNDIDKNALCVFGSCLHWERFEEMMDFAAKLERVVPNETDESNTEAGGKIRRSMLQHLLSTIQHSRKDDFEFYRNIGRLHGLVSRHGYRQEQLNKKLAGGKDRAAEIVRDLLKESASKERFADLIVPFQYVLYRTRVINQ